MQVELHRDRDRELLLVDVGFEIDADGEGRRGGHVELAAAGRGAGAGAGPGQLLLDAELLGEVEAALEVDDALADAAQAAHGIPGGASDALLHGIHTRAHLVGDARVGRRDEHAPEHAAEVGLQDLRARLEPGKPVGDPLPDAETACGLAAPRLGANVGRIHGRAVERLAEVGVVDGVAAQQVSEQRLVLRFRADEVARLDE
jgi:hypothetical protein